MQAKCRGCHRSYLLHMDEHGGHIWHTGIGTLVDLLSHSHINSSSCSQQSLPQNHCVASVELILCVWWAQGAPTQGLTLSKLHGGQGRHAPEQLDRVGSTGREDREVPMRTRSWTLAIPTFCHELRNSILHFTRNYHPHPKTQICRFSAGLSCGPVLGGIFQALWWGWKDHFVSLLQFVGQNQWDFQVCGCQSILSKC